MGMAFKMLLAALAVLAHNVIAELPPAVQDVGVSIAAAARQQVGKTLYYDPSYTRIAYPMGDVPIEIGVCTDVIIRALRDALSMDLQQLVHKDMQAAFSEYPKNWGLKKPDPNIDHRRVLNLRKYFSRMGLSLKVTDNAADYLPGDIVTCTLPGDIPHIMLVSDRKARDGTPLAIHNIGDGAKEENSLFYYPITGHYRVKPAKSQDVSAFTDTRDSTVYKKVKIGEQVWMAENLNYDVPDDTTDVCYENKAENCAQYGRLYDWNTALKTCPAGWHLPSDDEWTALTDFVGGDSIAGTKLKSTSGWEEGGNGTDNYGFSALPGGYGNGVGSFRDAGNGGLWWSAADGNASTNWSRRIDDDESVFRGYSVADAGLLSVRCVQDTGGLK